MRRSLLTITVALLAGHTAGSAAWANCSNEVAQGVTRQSNEKAWRKDANMITEQGPMKMSVEFLKPDRMRQVVTPFIDPKPIETILIGDKAWSNQGGAWKVLGKGDTDQLVRFFQTSTSQGIDDVGEFDCMGAETVDGRQLRAYRGLPPKAKARDAESSYDGTAKSAADAVPGQKPEQKNEAVRVVYLDPATGLLARSIYAREGMLDKPLFKEDFSYPANIKIEAPEIKP